MIESIDCTDTFCVVGRERLIDALEAGKAVTVYINGKDKQKKSVARQMYDLYLRDRYGYRLLVFQDGSKTAYKLHKATKAVLMNQRNDLVVELVRSGEHYALPPDYRLDSLDVGDVLTVRLVGRDED